jgi:hypothetical protein
LKEQKDALENGLVSMEDVQMAVAEGTLLALPCHISNKHILI